MIKFQTLADIFILTLQTGPRSPKFILSVLVMREQSPRVTGLKWPLTTAGKNDKKIPCTVSDGLLMLVAPTN